MEPARRPVCRHVDEVQPERLLVVHVKVHAALLHAELLAQPLAHAHVIVAVDTYSSSHTCPIDGSSVAYVAFEIPPPRALRGRERRERREAHEVRLNPRKKGKMSNDGRPTSSNCFWKLGPDDPSTKKPVCITAASRMVANFKDGACADDGSSALVRRLVVFSLAG